MKSIIRLSFTVVFASLPMIVSPAVIGKELPTVSLKHDARNIKRDLRMKIDEKKPAIEVVEQMITEFLSDDKTPTCFINRWNADGEAEIDKSSKRTANLNRTPHLFQTVLLFLAPESHQDDGGSLEIFLRPDASLTLQDFVKQFGPPESVVSAEKTHRLFFVVVRDGWKFQARILVDREESGGAPRDAIESISIMRESLPGKANLTESGRNRGVPVSC